MLKKRVVFALLWDEGQYCLSRNFRLQRVGEQSWLARQYRFDNVANAIDELMILDVTRGERQSADFLSAVSWLASSVQAPLSAGGGVRRIEQVAALHRAGADKIVYNSVLVDEPAVVAEARDRWGQQSIVASVDVRRTDTGYEAFVHDGTTSVGELSKHLNRLGADVGELLLNSIDLDGTGRGLDLGIADVVPREVEQPVVLMGGTGTLEHIAIGLQHDRVGAVATSNLLNFIGDGLEQARLRCAADGIALPVRLSARDVAAVDLDVR